MSLPTGLSQRQGVWQLRIGVPADLTHLYPRIDAYRGSLKTRDRAEAITRSHALIAEHRTIFDQQRTSETLRRAPPVVPLTAEHERYLSDKVGWMALVFDDVLRFTPGAVDSIVPGTRFLSSPNDPPLRASPDDASAKLQLLQQLALEQAKGDLATGRLDRVQRTAEADLKAMGVQVDWSTTAARLTLARIARAQVRAYQLTVERGQGEPHDTPARPVAPVVAGTPGTAKPSEGKTLADAFDAWKVGKKPDAINKTTRALAMVKAAGITVPLQDLTRRHALDFREHINATIPNASGKTRSDILASIQALLNFAVKERDWLKVNPWAGTAIAKGRAQKREAWDNSALTVLLATPLTEDRRVDRTAQYWLPLLALMTGARQAELCQLRPDDVIKRDGVWLLDINEADDGKSVKSAAGERWVAIHSKVIDLGFIEHVERMREAGESLVFPGILTSASRTAPLYVSDWFRGRCKALGLYQRWRDFHALRTTVGTALRAVHPPLGESLITKVMGHEASNVGMSNYDRPAPTSIQRVIESLDFPAVLALKRPT